MNQPTSSGTIRVACIDDHPHIIEGLAATFASTPDIKCVGRLASADGMVDVIRRSKADVVILDIVMPGTDAFEMLRESVRECPDVRTIVFSGHVRERYVDEAVQAGAWGFIDKSDPPEILISAIRDVVRGEFAFSPSIVGLPRGAGAVQSPREGRSRRRRDEPRKGRSRPPAKGRESK